MATLFTRMLLFGPLIYIAVIMLRDPADFYQLSHKLSVGLQNFRNQLWIPMPVVSPQAEPLSRQSQILVRFADAALVAASLVYLIS